MVNQRKLSDGEIKAINAIRSEASRVDLLVEEMEANPDLDRSSIEKAKTAFRDGFAFAELAVTNKN